MLFDSHAHLNDERFDEDREELIASLKEKQVDLVVNPGADIKSSINSVNLANKYNFIYAAVGVHPHDIGELDDTAIDTLRKLATENEKVVAIGEIGLDYYYDNSPREVQKEWFKKQIELANELKLPIIIHDRNEKVVAIGEIGLDYYYDNSPREVQKEWFKKQIELANELKLPIIIHDRDAHGDTFEIIKNTKSPEIGCVLHCYSGNVELAKEYVKMGCYISIPGTVTFKNNKKTREVAKEIPLEYLLIETDSPYMAPEPHRGKRNDPSLVAFVADKIAQEKGISYEAVCKATKENAKKLFNIK